MSKSITIIRHAKSSWKSAAGDHQRPLNERGCVDAGLIGGFLAQNSLSFDGVYCSDAKRAQQTLQILNASLNIDKQKLYYNDQLYLAELSQLLAIINELPSSKQNIVLLGHNPGLTMLCNYIANDNLDNLPTCGVCSLALHVDDWRAVDQGVGTQTLYCTPRILKEEN